MNNKKDDAESEKDIAKKQAKAAKHSLNIKKSIAAWQRGKQTGGARERQDNSTGALEFMYTCSNGDDVFMRRYRCMRRV